MKVLILGDSRKEKIIISNFRKSKVDGTSRELEISSQFAAPEVRVVQPKMLVIIHQNGEIGNLKCFKIFRFQRKHICTV